MVLEMMLLSLQTWSRGLKLFISHARKAEQRQLATLSSYVWMAPPGRNTGEEEPREKEALHDSCKAGHLALKSVQDTPREEILSIKEIYDLGGASRGSGCKGRKKEAVVPAASKQVDFCRGEILRRKGGVCARMS